MKKLFDNDAAKITLGYLALLTVAVILVTYLGGVPSDAAQAIDRTASDAAAMQVILAPLQ